MITSFADAGTQDIYNGENTAAARRLLPGGLVKVAVRKLDMLNAAVALSDLRVPPGNRLEALKGDLAGKYSIRINEQYRIVFAFKDGAANEVRIMDYH
jgi:toxin HigB-1